MNPALFLIITTAYFFVIVCAVVSVKEKNLRTFALFLAGFVSWLMIFMLYQEYILYPVQKELAVYNANEYQSEVIGWIPKEFTANLSRIIMIDGSFFDYPAVGTYYHDRKTIYINKEEEQYFFRDIYHEIGHHVENTLLTKQERDEWLELYNQTGSMTWYGKTSEEEGFAEAFTCFYYQSNWCYEIPIQTEFIINISNRIRGLST